MRKSGIKLWFATVAKERIEQAMRDYKRLGYSDNWINQRMKSMKIRKELTDIIYKTWAGKTAKEYKKFKRLKKEGLRDNMTNKEFIMNMLAELNTILIKDEKTMENKS